MKDPLFAVTALVVSVVLVIYVLKAFDALTVYVKNHVKLQAEDKTPIYYELRGLGLVPADANRLAKSIYNSLSIDRNAIPFISRGKFDDDNYLFSILLNVDDKRYGILYNHSFQVVKYQVV